MMQSVERVVAVLESFTPSKRSLRLQEIADRCNLPKSTTFRITGSLERAGYLVRLEDQRYYLSPRFTQLAGLVSNTLDIRRISRSAMVELCDRTRETVAVFTASGRDRVCVDCELNSDSQLRMVVHPGERVPLQLGASADILLACMTAERRKPLAASIAQSTKRSKIDLEAGYARTRKRGYAISHGARTPGCSAIAAPIWDTADEAHYCLTVCGPSVRIKSRQPHLIEAVVDAAAEISRQCTVRG